MDRRGAQYRQRDLRRPRHSRSQPGGKVSCWKPGDGPDIETTCVINIDFVYPRNY